MHDAAAACDLITTFTSDASLDTYRGNPMLRSAVERQLEIVGEALRAAAEIDPDMDRQITGLARIIALRNRLAHAYAAIADEVVWGIVEGSLPALRRELAAILFG